MNGCDMMARTKGWKFEPARHSLAAKGVKTSGLSVKACPVKSNKISNIDEEAEQDALSMFNDGCSDSEILKELEGQFYLTEDEAHEVLMNVKSGDIKYNPTYTPGGPLRMAELDILTNSPAAIAALKETLVQSGYATPFEFEQGANDGDVLAMLFEDAVTKHKFDYKKFLRK